MRVVLLVLVLVASFASGGCSLFVEHRTAGEPEFVVDELGRVVGHREVFSLSGGVLEARVTLYTPRRDDRGEVVGYEERTRSGAIIRDLAGNVVGNRFGDLRSRGTNPRNAGITVVFGPAPPRATVPLAEVRRDLLAVR